MSNWNDAKYDAWRLATPYDNEGPEVFETDKHNLFSCDEDAIAEFNDLIKKPYDKCADNFEEYIEYLQDELTLDNNSYDAQNRACEDIRDAKEYANER